MTRQTFSLYRRVLTVCALAALLSGCRERAELSLPPEDDVFVSYYQAAYGLASGLTRFKSAAELTQQESGIDQLIEQLARYGEQVEAIPAVERELMMQQQAELIERTHVECDKLEEFHSRNPAIIGERWERLWALLPHRDQIASPVKQGEDAN